MERGFLKSVSDNQSCVEGHVGSTSSLLDDLAKKFTADMTNLASSHGASLNEGDVDRQTDSHASHNVGSAIGNNITSDSQPHVAEGLAADVNVGMRSHIEAVASPEVGVTIDIDNYGISAPYKSVKDSTKQSTSFANVLNNDSTRQELQFRYLVNEERVDKHDTLLPLAAMKKVLSRYDNTLVGYFLGKTIAFPNVKSYVTNTWGKFGLLKLMKNGDGVYLFKFATKEGMNRVLERGPWLIRNSPIIINKWTPTLSLNKNEVTKVPVWIKLHKVPLLAYSEDGLSLIATQVGKPIMLDAFTSSMCVDSWGRISFARALVELSADSELKSQVTMAIPNDEGNGFSTEIIDVEYEWKPPHCGECKSFGHSLFDCPNCVREPVRNDINVTAKVSNPADNHEEGFIEVRNRKNKGKNMVASSQSKPIGGIKLSKPKPNFWRPKVTVATNQNATNQDSNSKIQKEASTSNVNSGTNSKSSNSFSILESLVDEDPKVQVEASKLCTHSYPSTSSAKMGNPFSKVGDVVVSDSSDDDEVLEDHVGTLYSGSGRNEQSLYEQCKADMGDCNKFEDDFFDDCGLTLAQLKAAAKHDFRLG